MSGADNNRRTNFMGRSNIIPIIVRSAKTQQYLFPWQVKYMGRPSESNLSKARDTFNLSLLPGGANAHLGIKHWIQTDLEVYDQKKKKVIATYKAPKFEIIPSH